MSTSLIEDIYDLDSAFAEWIVPRVRALSNDIDHYDDSRFACLADFQSELRRMADGFEAAAMPGWDLQDDSRERVEESLELFKKNFRSLWL